jgi:hypothetical protein
MIYGVQRKVLFVWVAWCLVAFAKAQIGEEPVRKAEELSITTAPALIATGTNSRDRVAPALKKAKSTPSNAEASNLRTRYSCI